MGDIYSRLKPIMYNEVAVILRGRGDKPNFRDFRICHLPCNPRVSRATFALRGRKVFVSSLHKHVVTSNLVHISQPLS